MSIDVAKLKKSFHELIDSIDNEHLLMNFHDLIKTRSGIKDGQLWWNLSSAEQEELLKAFDESENPDNLINHMDMKNKHKKLL